MTAEHAWVRIMGWLGEHTPATAAKIRPPAGPQTLASVEASFPAPWPADLRRWFQLQDGEQDGEPWGGVLTEWSVLPLNDILDEAVRFSELMAEFPEIESHPRAGEYASIFLPEFVPIGHNGASDVLFVDLRPGTAHGCVTGYFKVDGDYFGPIWTSVAAMLEDIAHSLETGQVCNGWTPRVLNAGLDWD